MKIIDVFKLRKENRKLKKEVKTLTKELDVIYKGIVEKGELVVVPKKIFFDIWEMANNINEVYVYQNKTAKFEELIEKKLNQGGVNIRIEENKKGN